MFVVESMSILEEKKRVLQSSGGTKGHSTLMMRKGGASVPEKVLIPGVGGSSMDKNRTVLTQYTNAPYYQIFTPPPCSNQTNNVGVSDPTDGQLYTTPIGVSTNGTGQRPALGRHPVIHNARALLAYNIPGSHMTANKPFSLLTS